jgi:hypothetical protein
MKRCAYAFGLPLLFTTILVILQYVETPDSKFLPKIDSKLRCWFSNDWGIGFYFYGPIAVVLLSNTVFFALTAHFLIKHRSDTKNLNLKDNTMKRY